MVKRLIVHAGFHKTGTTTVQNTLAAHRAALAPHLRVILRPDMIGLCEAARAYSRSRSAFDLGMVTYEAALLAEAWDDETVLLSSEDLSGHMPGRHEVTTYDAAPALVAAMTDTWHSALPGVQIAWCYYTRAAQPWLASCHTQHLRAARMTMSVQDYVTRFAASADLDGVVSKVRAAVRGASVHSHVLEDHSADPVAPVLALAGVPQDMRVTITPLPPANTSPNADKRAAMLELNRSDLPDSDWRAAQNALRRRGR